MHVIVFLLLLGYIQAFASLNLRNEEISINLSRLSADCKIRYHIIADGEREVLTLPIGLENASLFINNKQITQKKPTILTLGKGESIILLEFHKRLKLSGTGLHSFELDVRSLFPKNITPDTLSIDMKFAKGLDTSWFLGSPEFITSGKTSWKGTKGFPYISVRFNPDACKWLTLLQSLSKDDKNPRLDLYKWQMASIFGEIIQEAELTDERLPGLWREVLGSNKAGNGLKASACFNLSEYYKGKDGERFYLKKAIEYIDTLSNEDISFLTSLSPPLPKSLFLLRWGSLLIRLNERKEGIEALKKSINLAIERSFIDDYFYPEEGDNEENYVAYVWKDIEPDIKKKLLELDEKERLDESNWRESLKVQSNKELTEHIPFYAGRLKGDKGIEKSLQYQQETDKSKTLDPYRNIDILNAFLYYEYIKKEKKREYIKAFDNAFLRKFPDATIFNPNWLNKSRLYNIYAVIETSRLNNDMKPLKKIYSREIVRLNDIEEKLLLSFEIGYLLYTHNNKSMGSNILKGFLKGIKNLSKPSPQIREIILEDISQAKTLLIKEKRRNKR